MDAMCDLSANIARFFKLIRRSWSPLGGCTVSDGGWGIVMSRRCSLATGWFVCFPDGGERRIMMSAGCLVGASGISPVGSMMVSYAVFVRNEPFLPQLSHSDRKMPYNLRYRCF